MLDKIERFRHIHATGEDIRPVPHVVADGLDHTPSTHRSGANGLVRKLELIIIRRSENSIWTLMIIFRVKINVATNIEPKNGVKNFKNGFWV